MYVSVQANKAVGVQKIREYILNEHNLFHYNENKLLL